MEGSLQCCCSSYVVTLMETLVESEQSSNSPVTLIFPYPKISTEKSDVKRKGKGEVIVR